MAIVILAESFNFRSDQDWNWVVTNSSASSLTISDGVNTQTFAGSFTYDGLGNVSGTTTASSYFINGNLVYAVTDMAASASVLQMHANTFGDTFATYAYVLRLDDTVIGSSGDDTIVGYAGNDLLKGDSGQDWLYGDDGRDELVGGDDNDFLDGGIGNDLLTGYDGDDSLNGGDGDDYLDGGIGIDTAVYSGLKSAYAITRNGTVIIVSGPNGADRLSSVEKLQFSDITIDSSTTYTWSTLTNGQIILAFDPNLDIFEFDGIAASDVVVDIDDTPGNEFLSFSNAGKTVTIRMNPLSAASSNIQFRDFSLLLIGDNTTAITNDDSANSLAGDTHEDQIIGLGGADRLSGGSGNDRFLMSGNSVTGLYGNDTVDGGNGIDVVDFSKGAATGVVVNLAGGIISSGVATGGDGNPGSTLALISIENVIGTSFADILTGDAQQNEFKGMAGNDTLIGGFGDDTATYSGPRSAYTVVYSSGDTTVSGAEGTDTLISIERLKFADIILPNQPSWNIDHNGNGTGDILWRNSTGEVALWLMNGVTPTAQTVFGSVPVTTRIVDGNGDYNGDGKSDILWRDNAGNVTLWLMNGITPTSQTTIGSVPNTWTLVDGHGDYNGDGKDDLLWRNSNGDTALWLMNGSAFLKQAVFGSIPINWSLIDGSADYNGDGKCDLLWRNSAGDAALWLMNGVTPIGQKVFGSVPPTWNIVDGHGDYNGDGNNDLLWRNSAGDTALWLMNGVTPIGQKVFGSVPTSWSIVDGHGDYNGDGMSDVLWRNSTGDTALWLMNGVTPIGQKVFGSVPTTWNIVDGHSDYNGDGNSDVLWRNSNGDVAQWLMSGQIPIGQAVFANVPTTWSITTELGGLLSGDGAADTLTGTTARDTLIGNGGADTLAGGTGEDTFQYNATTDSTVASSDRITDFAHGIDKIDLSQIDANTLTVGDQAFLFGGNNANTVANSVTWSEAGGNTILQIDNTGDTTADMQVVLTGVGLGLTATDFGL